MQASRDVTKDPQLALGNGKRSAGMLGNGKLPSSVKIEVYIHIIYRNH